MISAIARGAVTASRNVVRKPWFKMGASVGGINTTTLPEPSGMTSGFNPANDGYLWCAADSGASASLIVLSTSNAATAGTWTFTNGSVTNADWESLTSFSLNGSHYLVIGDVGNNANASNAKGTGIDVIFYRFPEPTITGSNGTVATTEIIQCAYPAGNIPSHKDAEAIFADPDTGDLYLITKRISPVLLYKLPYASSYTGIQTLTYVGQLTNNAAFNVISTTVSGNNGYVTDACISPNGNEIIVRSYDALYMWRRNKSAETIGACLNRAYDTLMIDCYPGGGGGPENTASTNKKFFHPTGEPQGENVAFDRQGLHFYTCSEWTPAGPTSQADESGSNRFNPLFKYERITTTPTTVSFQQGTNSYTGCVDTYIDSSTTGSANTTNFSSATSLTCDYDYSAYPTISRWRQALIKWDISSIPTTATVIAAYLDFYISNEGRQFEGHKMLQSWNAATITYSNSSGISLDNVEASSTADCFVYGTAWDSSAGGTGRALDAYVGYAHIPLSTAVAQAWVSSPSTNYGMVMTGGAREQNGDGLQVDSAEGATVAQRPKLTIVYI